MTKHEEIAHLTKFVESYPEDSYCKGTLIALLYEAVMCIRSDTFPQVSIAECGKIAEHTVAAANAKAAEIVAAAEIKAAEIRSNAATEHQRFREAKQRALSAAITALEKL